MSDTFTASNEIQLRVNDNGWIERRNGGELGTGIWAEIGGINTTGPSLVWDALRELVEHERDKELGRWRWPKSPNWVVYSNGGNDAVAIHEPDGLVFDITRWEGSRDHEALPDVAEAYFAAHPEPRPWHDAKPGEVWVLSCPRLHADPSAYTFRGGMFRSGESGALQVTDSNITDGRRIWPEVTP